MKLRRKSLNNFLDQIQLIREYFANHGYCNIYSTDDGILIEYGTDDWHQYSDNISYSESLFDLVKKNIKEYVESFGLEFSEFDDYPGGTIPNTTIFIPINKIVQCQGLINTMKKLAEDFKINDTYFSEIDNNVCFYILDNQIIVNEDGQILLCDPSKYKYVSLEECKEELQSNLDKIKIQIYCQNVLYDPIKDIIRDAINKYDLTATITKQEF